MIEGVFGRFRDWYRDLETKLTALDDANSLTEIYDVVTAHLDAGADYHPAIEVITRGTFQLIFQFVLNLKRHLPTGEQERLRREFLSLFMAVSREMDERLFALHERLLSEFPAQA